ncbi:MAG: GNAT family N-acetyltransferase [Tissierellia bacterium]|nr:GNAT family N-acetyltransferase [Tissierellia bacterium]
MSKIRIRIRKANTRDAVSMSIIHANSWRKAYKGLLPDEYLNKIQDTQWINMITKGLEDNTMNAWVATIEDIIIACTCVGNSRYKGYEGQLELISIYVLPEYWNLGAGSLLIEEVLEYAVNNKYKEVGLWVLDDNSQAIRFYEKKGFFNNGDTISCMIGENSSTEKRYIKKLV